ncbi:unnamed protein product [Trichobilharzia szidati]|nr:unnamed protein product [Trichobilharzia szidati]CAH8840506.1 unnamed protein product [Trichobilharzia szidati]
MESDDSYETVSVNLKEDTESDLSDNQSSDHSNHHDTREGNCSSCDGYLSNGEVSNDTHSQKQYHSFSRKLKEQGKKIKLLEQERIGFLEQIANLCSSLEKKQQELVEVLQLSEEKAKYHAHYMTEVSNLLAELGTLFPENTNSCTQKNKTLKCPSEVNDKKENSSSTENTHVNASSTNSTVDDNCNSDFPRDNRGRALLDALSVAVNAAKNMNYRKTSTNDSQISQVSDVVPSESSNGTSHRSVSLTANRLPQQFSQPPPATKSPVALEVRILPSFCWNADHVLYWLREYVCLPGGCLEAASRLRMDGKQLTSVIDKKVEKLLNLNDAGLRRKFFSALEDLRIHGPPGLSRHPGASHITYQWICDTWLKHHLGLAQLIPLFAIRRVDGRMLASLISYKRVKHSGHGRHRHHSSKRKSKHTDDNTDNNISNVVISNPTDDQISLKNYSEQNLVNVKSNKVISINSNNTNSNSVTSISSRNGTNNTHQNGSNNINNVESPGRNWHVSGRKEMLHILLGLSSKVSLSSSNSGADLPIDCKYSLGKREAESLRAAIELLHHHNFNVESIEKIRTNSEPGELDLLYWTNDHINKWLCDLGLKDFTNGIEASGLHGAYMVLDASFDFDALIKRLRIPTNIANACKLHEHLQRVLKPARIREGISMKQHGIFRRRSASRPNYSSNMMQRSMTSNSAINGSYLSLTNSSSNDTNYHSSMNGNVIRSNPNKILTSPSSPPSLPTYLTGSTNLMNNYVDIASNNPIGLTPKREKRRVLTVTGDLMNPSRLTRVFTRSRKTSQTVIDSSYKQLPNAQILRQMSITGLNVNNTSGSSNNLDWISDVEDRSSTLVRKQSEKSLTNSTASKSINSSSSKDSNKRSKAQNGTSAKSSLLNHHDKSDNTTVNNADSKKTTPSRQAVQNFCMLVLENIHMSHMRHHLWILLVLIVVGLAYVFYLGRQIV